ncbi:MAG: hypothetical protein M0Q51_03585 [Bacteroidales bacterium]|nr:hypothetical protein [Bacteroidales bacterium]
MIKKQIISSAIFLAISLSAISQLYYGGLSSSFEMPRTQYIVDSTGN